MAGASALVSSAAGDNKVKGRLGCGLGVCSQACNSNGISTVKSCTKTDDMQEATWKM